MAAKVLQLRSADGKVLVAPAWDYRPRVAQAVPLEVRVPSRALERVLQYWTKHSLAKATGESRESLARWDADFQRHLEEDGLTKEAAAAAQELRRHGVHHGGRPRRHAATAPSAVAAPASGATRADPVRAWCQLLQHLRGVNPGEPSPVPAMSGALDASDIAAAARPGPASATTLPASAGADPVDVRCAIHARATASRARERQIAQDEESTCHHRKRPASKACSSMPANANAAAPGVKKVSRPVASKACSFLGSTPLPAHATALKKMTTPAASTLRARRGMGELSCKIPKQSGVTAAAPRRQPIPCLSPVVLRLR
ncbi:transcriptional regulatory protein AlgP-like [Hordeum vulgare subsp. vulgare]|uniref:Uncharacterized protein n=1 Tax=Hordeum vulgare subsp. vulgare TaxID=112509 RepID=A0A8I7B567_HORVV|nr:transcriptional regulatory protein AlgP-like [Hordeum vulgare subsp. vulgare]XP_044969541.1 transcriptional regulatory protein AlgP-like [Hordeum vulgare subsp. vulgare]XP_044969542.1 transcriptional regulatory protein AlgP-like [Hordeum vulgare subsp. vulgare]